MSDSPDVVHILRDEAFFITAALADHILENANAYHTLAEAEKFPGRDRMAFSIMLTMFDEMGKLLQMVRECEKTAKADHPSVRVEDFHNNALNGRRGLGQIFEEIRTIEAASVNLGFANAVVTEEPDFLREEYASLDNRSRYFQIDKIMRKDTYLPTIDIMDKYAAVIERNALAAGTYLHDLGKALGLWVSLELSKVEKDGRVRYR